jgi:hypothetical protein
MTMPVFLDPTRRQPVFGTPVEIDLPEGWPDPERHVARPRDELGEKIILYAKANGARPDFPASPWDSRRGEIHLPDLDQPRPATDEVPKYRVADIAAFIGCVMYTKDQVVPFAGWPSAPYAVAAENESTRLVLEYMTKFSSGQKLTGMPYQNGQLFFPNPALRSNAMMPTVRWS